MSGQQPIEVWWQIHAGEDGNGETSQEVGRGIVVHDGTVFVAGTTALLDPNNTANFIRPDPPLNYGSAFNPIHLEMDAGDGIVVPATFIHNTEEEWVEVCANDLIAVLDDMGIEALEISSGECVYVGLTPIDSAEPDKLSSPAKQNCSY